MHTAERRSNKAEPGSGAKPLSVPLLLLMLLVLTRLTRYTRASLFHVGSDSSPIDLDPSKLVALMALGLIVAAMLIWPRRRLISVDLPLRFLLIFYVYTFISAVFGYDTRSSLVFSLQMTQWVVLYLLVISFTRDRADLSRWGTMSLIGTIVVLAAMVGDIVAPNTTIGAGVAGRPTWVYLEIYPRWAIFFLGFALHYAFHGRRSGKRAFGLGAIGACLLTVYLSARRAAPVGVLLVIGIYTLLAGRRNRALWAMIAAVVALGAIAVAVNPQYAERLSSIPLIGGETSVIDDSERVLQYLVGLELFVENPVSGVGLGGATQWTYDNYGVKIAQHSLILKLASELGFVGLVLYGLFIASGIKLAFIALRNRQAEGDVVGHSWSAAVISSLFGMLFWAQIQPSLEELPIYLAIGLASATAEVYTTAEADRG
ncbi:MAG: O-antigen ligase family protein [candidate division WS1 bacterium]|jgi:O-antigen ligase|nr:O-antigen ligase family protein [candidate division WS1 bacterium]